MYVFISTSWGIVEKSSLLRRMYFQHESKDKYWCFYNMKELHRNCFCIGKKSTVRINYNTIGKYTVYTVHPLSYIIKYFIIISFPLSVCTLLRDGWFSILVDVAVFVESEVFLCSSREGSLPLAWYQSSLTFSALGWFWNTRLVCFTVFLHLCNFLHWVQVLLDCFFKWTQTYLRVLCSDTGLLSPLLSKKGRCYTLFYVCLEKVRCFSSLLL